MSNVRYEWRPGAAEAIEAWHANQPPKRPNPLYAKLAKKACSNCDNDPPVGYTCQLCGTPGRPL